MEQIPPMEELFSPIDDIFSNYPFSHPGFEESSLFPSVPSPNQTVPSISPNNSPPYSPNSTDYFGAPTILEYGDIFSAIPLPVKREDPPGSPSENSPKPEAAAVPSTPPKTQVLGKKRTRKNGSSKNDPQNLSKKALEEYAQFEGRAMSIDEEKQMKKQRRLIKNRESAQLSRQRKKQYIMDLEQKVRMMANDSDQLRQQVAELQRRNIELENQVAQMKSIVNSPSFKNPRATIGLCMVVFLVSLGLFFNTPGSSGPELNVLHNVPSIYTGRILQQVDPETLDLFGEGSLLDKRERGLIDSVPVPASKKVKIQVFDDIEEVEEDFEYYDDVPHYPMLDFKRDEPENPHGLSVVSDPSPSHPFISFNQYRSNVESDSSFIYCPDAHQIFTPPSEPVISQTGPPVITVLMPSSALNGTIPDLEYFLDDPDNSLLEVSCQILNITVHPFYPGVDGRNFPNLIESS